MRNEILLIPDKPDIERDSVAKTWIDKGGEVLRIGPAKKSGTVVGLGQHG